MSKQSRIKLQRGIFTTIEMEFKTKSQEQHYMKKASELSDDEKDELIAKFQLHNVELSGENFEGKPKDIKYNIALALLVKDIANGHDAHLEEARKGDQSGSYGAFEPRSPVGSRGGSRRRSTRRRSKRRHSTRRR